MSWSSPEAGKEATATALGKPRRHPRRDGPTFYPAEDYHQNFWQGTEMLGNGVTRAEHYARYRVGCGKNRMVEAIWGAEAFRGLDGHVESAGGSLRPLRTPSGRGEASVCA